MRVILLERVDNLGAIGDLVNVKAGYGRNYLIPQRKAAPANDANLAHFEERRHEYERLADARLAEARERAEALAELDLSIAVKVGEGGKLYGSVGVRDIVELANARGGVQIARSEVRLPDGPMRELGDYEIEVRLHSDVITRLRLAVVEE